MQTSQKAGKTGLLKEIKNSFEASVKDPFTDMDDSFNEFTNPFSQERFTPAPSFEKKEPKRIRRSEVVFNRLEAQEQARLGRDLEQLMKEVKKEIELLKVQDKSLIEDLSKLTLTELPKTPGIYHLRFLEFIIKLLRSIRQKISEGRMWLQASFDKKRQKKFWSMAKKKGTKFSMSKELSQANIPG